ncbi:carnitinyl-CoA dehydratase [Nocardia nova SH22a]|uniref:Carnitinyl-CoA dehydratase n=1 Tax=Nocardia nova SH22a TaxID=1415166 RepID=W5TJW1_9NOCA|nr:crotonase/enoyl-CoA hydratase family protein [Nocardia nova]AHH17531.1 carnitinyl-CoA dehydratase [Nocardia nova SH22a]
MSADELVVEEHGRVLVLRLNRPQARNAVNLALATRIAAALDTLDERTDLSVGIITGNGPAFCAGMDLKAFAAGERPVVEGRGFAGLVRRPPRKPLIAAVDGFALAGGFEIVLACDLVVASKSSVFGLPEVRRGLAAAGGGLLRLRERLPYHIAMELVLTGDTFDAQAAYDYGLVNRLTEPGRALPAALELAEAMAGNAPLAMAASKRVFIESREWTDAEGFDRQEAYVDPVRRSNDAREGATAFAEKRAPVWSGT